MNNPIPVAIAVNNNDVAIDNDELEWGEQQRIVHDLQRNSLPDLHPPVIHVKRNSDVTNGYSVYSCCCCLGLGGLIYGLYLIFGGGEISEKDGIIVAAVCGSVCLICMCFYLDTRDIPKEYKKDVVWVSGENGARQLMSAIKRHKPEVILSFTCKCNLSRGVVQEVVDHAICYDLSPNIRLGLGEKEVLKLNFVANVVTLDTETNYFIEMKKQQAQQEGHGLACLLSFKIGLKETEGIPPFVLIDRNEQGYAEKYSYDIFEGNYYICCAGCHMEEINKHIEEKNFPLTKVISVRNREELLRSFPQLNKSYHVKV